MQSARSASTRMRIRKVKINAKDAPLDLYTKTKWIKVKPWATIHGMTVNNAREARSKMKLVKQPARIVIMVSKSIVPTFTTTTTVPTVNQQVEQARAQIPLTTTKTVVRPAHKDLIVTGSPKSPATLAPTALVTVPKVCARKVTTAPIQVNRR